MRSAGCRGTRKVWEARLRVGVRWWRRKAAVFERGAWVVGGEAGMDASGQAGEACRWRAVWERGRAGASADVEMRLTRPIEKSHAMRLICYTSLRLFFW